VIVIPSNQQEQVGDAQTRDRCGTVVQNKA